MNGVVATTEMGDGNAVNAFVFEIVKKKGKTYSLVAVDYRLGEHLLFRRFHYTVCDYRFMC